MKTFLLFSTSVLFCSSIFAVSTTGLKNLRPKAIKTSHVPKLVASPKSTCSFAYACGDGPRSFIADCNTSYTAFVIGGRILCKKHGGMAKC